MNDCLIVPQEKHRNLKRDKDSKDSFHEVLPLVKFSPKLTWEEAFHWNFIGFHEVHSFHSKGYVEKNHIKVKSSKITMNFVLNQRAINHAGADVEHRVEQEYMSHVSLMSLLGAISDLFV